MNTSSCLPIEVRTAVFRRAVAQAYLDTCAFYRVNLGYTLDELQMTIALRLEGHLCVSTAQKTAWTWHARC